MAWTERQGQQVHKDRLVHKETLDHRVHKEMLAPQDHKAKQAQQGHKVNLVTLAQQVHKEI
jgi:hypothetical protein